MTNEYTLMGLSDLHDRVSSLFIKNCNKFHDVHLGNLYMSAKSAHPFYTHHNCVNIKGGCRTVVIGIHREVLQNKFHDKKEADRVR